MPEAETTGRERALMGASRSVAVGFADTTVRAARAEMAVKVFIVLCVKVYSVFPKTKLLIDKCQAIESPERVRGGSDSKRVVIKRVGRLVKGRWSEESTKARELTFDFIEGEKS